MAEAAHEYAGRLQPWVRLQVTELRAESVPDKSPAERERVRSKEALLLTQKLESLRPRVRPLALDERGRALTTAEWAKRVGEWEGLLSAQEPVVLVIGGSLGLEPDWVARTCERVSLGPQTLSHELARVVLLEQLYRAWSVARSHPYHNAD